MPELPEVETVRRSFQTRIFADAKQIVRLEDIELRRRNLRNAMPKKILAQIRGQQLRHILRWGKYLVFIFEEGAILSHLGMTGGWRLQGDESTAVISTMVRTQKKTKSHDHVVFGFKPASSAKQVWVYNDPRRFGVLDAAYLPKLWLGLSQNTLSERILFDGVKPYFKWLQNLGADPILEDLSGEDYKNIFAPKTKNTSSKPIKNAIMDQNKLVGVGNIYASEILFLSGISPKKKTSKITLSEWGKIAENTRLVLSRAIEAGGSTIDDYYSPEGEGSFQDSHRVYARKSQPCAICATKIKAQTMSGRMTYWCPQCQR